MGIAPVFADASQALAVARAALGYLAATDATQLTVAEQAGCLQGLEKLNSAAVAARTSILGAFTAGQGYAEDGDYSPRTWLMHQTGITHGAAVSHTAWLKWAAAHPAVHAALAAAMGRPPGLALQRPGNLPGPLLGTPVPLVPGTPAASPARLSVHETAPAAGDGGSGNGLRAGGGRRAGRVRGHADRE